MTRFVEIAVLSEALSRESSRNAKIATLAKLLREVLPAEVAATVGFLSGEPRFGKVGVGFAKLSRLFSRPAKSEATMDLLDVEARVFALSEVSAAALDFRLGELADVLTSQERMFLSRVIGDGLRQGSLEGVMLTAVAKAFATPEPEVRRATMLSGSLANVAASLSETGSIAAGLLELCVLRPILPMLASPADDAATALREGTGSARVDLKMDGVRVQVHKDGDVVRAFSRQRNDVTREVASLLAPLRSLPARSFVLDGEVVLFDDAGRPCAFQDTMSRFATEVSDASNRERGTLRLFAFDLLLLDGKSLIDEPLSSRVEALHALLPPELLMPSRIVSDEPAANAAYEEALASGHEGVVVKQIDSRYVAGSRDDAWRKVKKAITVDLVVLAAEWGSGRREGLLSNLHLGARAEDGSFVMVGKTFKGLTDAMLAEQTAKLLALEERRDAHETVFVRPGFVVEVAFSDAQRSPRYPGGVALRLARVKRFRPDKGPSTVESLEALAALVPPSIMAPPDKPSHKPKPKPPPPSPQLSLFGEAATKRTYRR